MLDHVFTDAIGALRDALETALLERLAVEERFHTDILLGDTTWETSYGLPGEGRPPKIKADITLDWPTWSQSSYRSWFMGEEIIEEPQIAIAVVVRVQRLVDLPEPSVVIEALPTRSPKVGRDRLERRSPTVETSFSDDLEPIDHAIEIAYEGNYELDEATLGDGSRLDEHFSALGGWIASILVGLGDIPLQAHPRTPES